MQIKTTMKDHFTSNSVTIMKIIKTENNKCQQKFGENETLCIAEKYNEMV